MPEQDRLPPLRDVIAAHDLAAKKSLGQNFLFDLNLTQKIARTAGPLDGVTVIEVGPGPGGLTRAILSLGAKKVIAIERDSRCLPALAEIEAHYPGRLEVIEGDALKTDFEALVPAGEPVRIIANLPADRPFALGLNLYSPHYAAIQLPQRVDLRPKGVLEGLSGQVRFLVNKQPERFRTALLAVLAHALSPDETTHRESAAARRIDEMLRNPIVAKIVRTMGLSVVLTHGVAGALQFAISPYKYSLWPAIPTETYQFLVGDNYDAKGDYAWSPIYSWDARKGDVDSRARLRHFIEFVKQRGIPTLIVNMPERDVSRGRYDRISYQVYRELLRDELARAGIEFVDMWEFLDTPEFYDREHTTEQGSTRLTDEIIRIARQTILQQSSGKASAAAR